MLKETADQKANALASVGVLILILMEHAQRGGTSYKNTRRTR